MPRLVYLTSALRDLAEIADDIQRRTQSAEAALATVERLLRHLERLAALPGLLGRARPELRRDCRSVVSGSYLLFIHYLDDERPRDVVEVIHVVHGARDLKAVFRRSRGAV